MHFIIAFLIVAIAGSVISTRTLCGYNHISLIGKSLIFILLLICWLMPIIMNLLKNGCELSPEIYSKISLGGYFLFGFAFILLMILLLRDILWFGAYGITLLIKQSSQWWSPFNISLLTKINIITIVLTLILSLYGLYEGLKIPQIKEIEISTSKVKQEIRILQINDVHIDRSKPVQWVAELVDKANAVNADIIVLPGDIVDDDINFVKTQVSELKRLKSRYGIYYSSGNHELYNGLISIQNYIQNLGIVWLSGKGVYIENLPLFIAGIPDLPMLRKQNNYTHLLDGVNDDFYKILLAHNPSQAQSNLALGFDLQLSSHTHGGQIFPFHIPVRIINNYLAGLYQLPEGLLYISRGAGYWGPPIRLLAPSDITLIKLLPEHK